MTYADLLIVTTGVSLGALASVYYNESIKPRIRASKFSGIPIYKIDTQKVSSLDDALRRYSKLWQIPFEPTGLGDARKAFPPEVQQVFDKHIHYRNLESWLDDDPTGANSHYVKVQQLKQRVKDFYREPVVQRYIQKSD